MRHYEIVLLVHPDQSEQVPGMLARYQELVGAESGRVHRVEDWGRRRLAYMINNVHKAHYLLLNIECSQEALRELEKNFKFNDSILRHLVIRRDQAISEPSAMARAKAEEDRIEAEKQAARSKSERGEKPQAQSAKPAEDAGAQKEEKAEKTEATGAAPVQSEPVESEPELEPEPESDPQPAAETEPQPVAEPEPAEPAEPAEQPETT